MLTYLPDNWSQPDMRTNLILDRGYTSHEHLAHFNLINMNGRVYDPVIGRFLSSDPVMQAPEFTQNYNRYSYCLNNPFIYIDPSGYMTWRGALVSIFGTAIGVGVGVLTNGIVGFTVIWDDETGYWDVHIASAYTGTYGIHFGQNEDGSWHVYGGMVAQIDWSQIGSNDHPIPEYDPGATDPITGLFVNSGSETYDQFVESYEYERNLYYSQLIAGDPNQILAPFDDWFREVWNSELMRIRIPDKISLSAEMGFALVKGVSTNIELNLITRGPEAGFFFTSSLENITGLVIDIGIINISFGSYLGPVNEVTRASYLGPCSDWDGGFIWGGSIWSSYNEAGERIWFGGTIGYGLTIGLSAGNGDTYDQPFYSY